MLALRSGHGTLAQERLYVHTFSLGSARFVLGAAPGVATAAYEGLAKGLNNVVAVTHHKRIYAVFGHVQAFAKATTSPLELAIEGG